MRIFAPPLRAPNERIVCTIQARLYPKVQQDKCFTRNTTVRHTYAMNLSRNVTKRSSDENTIIQEETFPAAEKILYDIENVLRKDHELSSFEIIPIQDSENKSPVYHEEHSLGLASWCVQPLYCYAYGRLIDLRRSDHRREEPHTVSRWLTGALLLNPDVTTFWNMKRELVRNGRLDALSELRFSTIVLFYKAKCFEAFAYRRWLIQDIIIGGKASNLVIETLLKNEINVAGISADNYANNYHAWSHREYVVTSYEKILPESYESLLKSEWNDSGKWCNRHVSDHSGLAYRQFLLKRLLFQRTNEKFSASITTEEYAKRRDFVELFVASFIVKNEAKSSNVDSWELLNFLHNTKTEKCDDVDYDRVLVALSYWAEDCKNNENLILSYPGHEALWYHRRFLAYALITIDKSYKKYLYYKDENFMEILPKLKFDSDCTRSKEINERSDVQLCVSPLFDIFIKDNEKIVSLSRTVESQTTLSEKFLKYLREFNFDLLNNEER